MKIEMSLKDYFKELDLMDKQYGQEEELYPLVNMILRANCNFEKEGLSLRDVHQSKGGKKRKRLLNGYKHRPDLVILDEIYEPDNDKELDMQSKMYAAIEVKTNNSKHKYTAFLDGNDTEDVGDNQVLGQLSWYGKVIYTNGLCWQYLKLNGKPKKAKLDEKGRVIDDSKNESITFNVKTICELNRTKSDSFNEKQWEKLKKNLSSIKWKTK